MGWRDRDYARWTDEERERFYGSAAAGGRRYPRSARGGLFRPGVGAAVLVSGAVFAAGHFPVGHPMFPFLRFTLPASHSSPATGERTGTISTPSTATVGSTLTFHGTAPTGNGPVTVEGSYDGGQSWQTLASVNSANGSYTAQVALRQRGLLQLRIVYADGSRAAGSVEVN